MGADALIFCILLSWFYILLTSFLICILLLTDFHAHFILEEPVGITIEIWEYAALF